MKKMRFGRRLGAMLLVGLASWSASAQNVRYVHTDVLGSISVVTDQSRNVVEYREYEPYGQSLSALKDGPGFTGHVGDSQTNLIYMQQRYYDPELGRFLSVDPVTALQGDLRHFNRYAYAYNNPYKYSDPDGRCPACVGAAVGAGLDLAIQLVEIGVGTRTEIDGKSILISAGTGALGVGLAGKVGRIGSLVVDVSVSAGSTALKGEDVTVGGVVADVVFGRAGGKVARGAITRTVEHRVAQRQVSRLERIGNKPNARGAQQRRAREAGPNLERNVEQQAAQVGIVSGGVGSAAEKAVEKKVRDDDKRK